MKQKRIQLEIGPYLRNMDIREDGKITFPDKFVFDMRTGETLKLPKQAKSYVVPHAKRKNGERGYIIQRFQVFGDQQSYHAHVLSAIAFLGDRRNEGLEVDHVNGDTTNNHHSNLEWVTHQENIQRGYARKQAREGGKQGKSITYKGVKHTYEEWSRELGGSPVLVAARMRLGWSEEAAVTTPPGVYSKSTEGRSITYAGVTRTVEEWSRELGGSSNMVRARLALGWSDEDAVATPIGGCRAALKKQPIPDFTDPQALATLLADPDILFPI